MALAKHCWVVKLGEFKSDQKYLAKYFHEILKTLKNNRNSSNDFQLMCPSAMICLGRYAGCFIYSFVIQVISEHCVVKVLLAIWEISLVLRQLPPNLKTNPHLDPNPNPN